jgi:hypothetical protein
LLSNNLEIEQDIAFQYRHWRRERLGWMVMALILIAGLSGIFGHHPLAKATSRTADGQLSIDYDRYARFDSSAEIVVTVRPEGQKDEPTRLWFDAAYLDSLRVLAVSPQPLRGEAREGERAFVFQTNGHPFTAVLAVQFQTVGIVHGHPRVDEQEALLLTHLVWP